MQCTQRSNEPLFHLTWIGSVDGSCGRLLERIRETCAVHGRRLRVHDEPLDSAVLQAALLSSESPVVAWADRLIVVCETRVEYPWQIIERLERLDSGVPWGVVTGSWQAGSRRTGIGPVTHWQLPWYQWWEGWYGWLFPELARPGSLSANQFETVLAPIDLATPARGKLRAPDAQADSEPIIELNMPGPARRILIVAACRATQHAWQLAAAKVGWDALAERPHARDDARVATEAPAPDCILWDDSSWDRSPDEQRDHRRTCRQLDLLKSSFPGVPIVAGLSLAHLSAWEELQRAGASDFFVKPSFGLPLADYLWARDVFDRLAAKR